MINASKDRYTSSISMDSKGSDDYAATTSESTKERKIEDKICEEQEVQAQRAIPVSLPLNHEEMGNRNIPPCDDEIPEPAPVTTKEPLVKPTDVAMKVGEQALHIRAASHDQNNNTCGGYGSNHSPRLKYEETGERTDAQKLIDHYDKIMALQRKMDADKASLHQNYKGNPSSPRSRSNSQISQEDTVVDKTSLKKKNDSDKNCLLNNTNTINENNTNNHIQHTNKRRRQATNWDTNGTDGAPIPEEAKASDGGC
jgi:hypothetical protein